MHKKVAFDSIEKAEKLNNIKLSPKIIKLADEYATEVFGGKDYAPWLYFYGLIYGKFEEGCIPQNFYSRFVLPDRGIVGVSSNKTFSNIVLNTETLPDIAYYLNGIFFNRDFTAINISEFRNIVKKYDGNILIKINQSLRGTGIFKLG